MIGPDDQLRRVEAWIFDLDNTLYAARHRLFDQVSRRMTEFVGRFLGLEPEAARALQKRYFRDHGTTLRGLVRHHDCDPRRFLAFVHDIDYGPIDADRLLDDALARLPGRKLIFTNGDVAHAERVTERLGVGRHFEAVFDIAAADYVPKPEPAAYDALMARHRIAGPGAAMFEDIPRNLEPAKARGMATVWIASPVFADAAGAGGRYIDHRADELAPWLSALADRLEAG